jgi:hypothetical protein
MDINNFQNNHTLNDFQQLALFKNVHSCQITSICCLKDGRIASSSWDKNIFIYNKNTFKIEIRIRENKIIHYININKDGILIACLDGTYLNLYEIKGKIYNNIQTIKPYNLLIDIVGKFDDSFSIQKFIELKNGDIAILVWAYALSFYKKKKNSKKYSFLNKFNEEGDERITDLCELDDNQYCIIFKYNNLIRFLDWNKKEITSTIKFDNFWISDSINQLLLMNKNDLLVAGQTNIIIIDTQKKEIIKNIKVDISGYLSSIYKLSENILIAGFWSNYIGQLEYDVNKKDIKLISKIGQKWSSSSIFAVSSISILNNNLIVTPYNNNLSYSSLIIYKLKNRL